MNSKEKSSENIISVNGLYKNWFLDYASYVILERAVPSSNDGLKPVQRRILHSMKELDDGRYNKVANIIGNTMKYHPHGDASIGDALVQIGQKELLIDCQGNWGNVLTGDSAAAPRYIEARLSKFALDVVFNNKTTEWLKSYDGRNNEPVDLPIKFPILLAQGVEGIAVGLSTKILPHNFNELIDASIKHLKGKSFEIFPDFLQGAYVDVTEYNKGERGGKVKIRAKIEKVDNSTLKITEIPFGTTTTSLIESILKAIEKTKIKVTKVDDNTAQDVEILIHLANKISPDKTIDALYAFTNCEISVSNNCCVIKDQKPIFTNVEELLKINTDNTVNLLKRELEIKLNELNEQWHFSSLEKIFIEKKIYVELHGQSYEKAIELTHVLLKPYISNLIREVTDDDLIRLLEIRMRRITKHDSEKADNYIASIEEQLIQVKFNLDNIIDYSIDYFQNLKKKYGKGKERKTEIRIFDAVNKQSVIINNQKLFVNYTTGFAGYGLKKDEYVCDCSDIDDVIVFLKSGEMIVSKISEKAYFGKDIIHVNIWKKGDKRTIYHLIYKDGNTSKSYMKRFYVNSVTRDKTYYITSENSSSKVHYFSANHNGKSEIVEVILKNRAYLKKTKFSIDFADLMIKSRTSLGNMVTKHDILKIVHQKDGSSTLEARKLWYDDNVKKLNIDENGELIGSFGANDKLITITQSGYVQLFEPLLHIHFPEDMIYIGKFDSKISINVIYWNHEKQFFHIKRFEISNEDNKKNLVIPDDNKSYIENFIISNHPYCDIIYDSKKTNKEDETINLREFIEVKNIQAIGNRITKYPIKEIKVYEKLPVISNELRIDENGNFIF